MEQDFILQRYGRGENPGYADLRSAERRRSGRLQLLLRKVLYGGAELSEFFLSDGRHGQSIQVTNDQIGGAQQNDARSQQHGDLPSRVN